MAQILHYSFRINYFISNLISIARYNDELKLLRSMFE
jgi:hypothetical protein